MSKPMMLIHTDHNVSEKSPVSGGNSGLRFLSALLTVLAVSTSTIGLAGVIKPQLAQKLQQTTVQDEVSVIITLNDQLNPNVVSADGAAGKMRPSEVHASLQSKAIRTQQRLKKLLKDRNAKKVISFWIFNGMAATVPAGIVDELARLPEVHSVQLDATISLPQPVPAATGAPEWNISAISAPDMWNLGYTGTGVVVAGMDTGVDVAHQDLLSRWRGGTNSWFDPYGEHATPYDSNGHGTQTMGVIVGGDAGGSAVGVAPGATWIGVKIFNDQGLASYSGIHLGFQWLLDPDGNPLTDDFPHIVNNSWGFDNGSDQCLTEFQLDVRALKAVNIAVVFSAGNTGPNAATSISPANYAESFSVGAVDDQSVIAPFSGRGPAACNNNIYPDVVAPGVNIKAPDRTFGITPDAYTYVSGTSIAAPLVSGGMALLLSADQQLTVNELETSLAQSAVDLGQVGADYDYGNGFIDVLAAYSLINSGQGLCTDKDGDGFGIQVACPGVQDCDDGEPGVYPGATEIKHDGIDQDCNGYDLTIDIQRSEYRVVRDGIVVWATSALGENAMLQADIPGVGVQPMTWSTSTSIWKTILRSALQNGFDPDIPGAEIIVNGAEGAQSASVNTN